MPYLKTLSSIDWCIIAFYLALTLFLGLRRQHNGANAAEDYILAGRKVTLPAFVASLVSTWYGGILGVGEFSYSYGVSNWLVFGVPYYLYALIFAFFLARRARRSLYFTIPDQIEHVYGRRTSIASAAFIYLLTQPAPYLLMLGILLQLIFGLPLWLGVCAGAAFSLLYIYRSGLSAVIRTDVLQFCLMFAGFAMLVAAAASRFGGFGYLRAHLPPLHLTWHGNNSLQYILVWYLIAAATLLDPNFFQRCYAARTERVARNGILLSILFWIAFDFLTTTAGLYARAALPELAHAAESYPRLALQLLPAAARGLFFVALLATIMSTLDSFAFVSAITLGRDFYAKIVTTTAAARVNRYIKIALIFTMIAAAGIALLSKSIIAIWYQLGSVSMPAVLLPLASSFSEKWKMTPGMAFANVVGAGGLSLIWIVAEMTTGKPWLGIEGIYPGLALSVGLFAVGRFLRRVEPAR